MAGEAPRREFYVATPEEIRSGQTSDIYFFRTLDVLKKAGKDRVRVLMETTAQALPNGWPWAGFAGLEAAGERRVISFGVRRMHPALAPLIERCVYLGGLDSVTTPLGAAMLGKEPMGPMPPALTIGVGGGGGGGRTRPGRASGSTPPLPAAGTSRRSCGRSGGSSTCGATRTRRST